MSDKDSFFVRFNWGKFKLDAPQGQAACCLPTPAEAAARFDLGPFVAGIQNTRLTTHGAGVQLLAGPLAEPRQRAARRLRATRCRSRSSPTSARSAADSLGIRGINVTEFTTGLPNINIPDLTGISGGPAFLPVNPKQFHWQIEDALVWLKGRHQLKFGYRLVDRYPSPFTNTDTRGTINFGRNYTNNPVTNTGGSGHRVAADRLHQQRRARLPARAVHAAHAGARAVRAGRLQGQPALHHQRRRCATRSSGAETEEDNKIVNFDPVEPAADLCRRGRRQPLGEQEDATTATSRRGSA